MEIEQLRWRPSNVAKLAQHGISRDEVEQVIGLDQWVIDRHPAYPDQVRVIGPTLRGRLLTIVLEETENASTWRPVTGWSADDNEVAYYYREAHEDD